MDPELQRIVYERLQSDGSIDEDWSVLVIAACEGPASLETVLTGSGGAGPSVERGAHGGGRPAEAFLRSVTVQGFRGIGPETTLELAPGPGLTLVVGRNGSGKSSFAEALEVALTGDSRRWTGRSRVWRQGWRNLHHGDPALVEAEFLLGSQGEARVTRKWPADADLDGGTATVQPKGRPKTTLDELGWSEALVTHRPFLSYNELGSMLDDGPTKLYDALSLVLGLDDLVEADRALAQARLERTKVFDAARAELTMLLDRLRRALDDQDDERARRCLEALSRTTWDLDSVDAIAHGHEGEEAAGAIDALRRAMALDPVSPERVTAAAERLRRASQGLAEVSGTDSDRARALADILDRALAVHATHGDGDCPVCGNRDALDASWREATEEQARRLRSEAAASEAAIGEAASARRAALELLTAPPPVLDRLAEAGIDARETKDRWVAWQEGRNIADLDELAAHLEDNASLLADSVAELVKAATDELRRREDRWRPLAADLRDWVEAARRARAGMETVPAIKSAEKWLKGASQRIRDERFAPIAERAMRTWTHLRQQSNVELGRIELAGAKTQRRVSLDVTVDGVSGAALGVMSQGELHSLALSLFLPRATLEESPFRFIVVDDPVQSMDPARVDGLARAFEEVARDRQVIVFTHDPRLPDAARRLGIEATVIEVTRRPGSIVEPRRASDPVAGYIEDAFALASTKELDEQVRRRVIPGFCRSALEAACVEVIWRRKLSRGVGHAEVEKELEAAKLTTLAALALFDDRARGGDVMGRLNQYGTWAGDAFKRANKGAHEGYAGDLIQLVRDTESLCKKLLAIS